MAYQKQTWENLPSTNTPITAARLNHIEDGIYEASESTVTVVNEYSTSTTDSYSANYVNGLTENAKPVILYENNSGSSSSITLNESVNNYRFVEVFYKGPNGSVGSTKAPVISGSTRINLHTANPYNNNMYIQNETISISGTSVTRGAQREAVMTSGTYPTIANTNIYIVCIVGY